MNLSIISLIPLLLLVILIKILGKELPIVILTIIGAIAGLVFAKNVLFDGIEQLAWEFFWDALKHNHISTRDFKDIVSSTTFIKSTLGFFTGGIIGYFIGESLKQKLFKGE